MSKCFLDMTDIQRRNKFNQVFLKRARDSLRAQNLISPEGETGEPGLENVSSIIFNIKKLDDTMKLFGSFFNSQLIGFQKRFKRDKLGPVVFKTQQELDAEEKILRDRGKQQLAINAASSKKPKAKASAATRINKETDDKVLAISKTHPRVVLEKAGDPDGPPSSIASFSSLDSYKSVIGMADKMFTSFLKVETDIKSILTNLSSIDRDDISALLKELDDLLKTLKTFTDKFGNGNPEDFQQLFESIDGLSQRVSDVRVREMTTQMRTILVDIFDNIREIRQLNETLRSRQGSVGIGSGLVGGFTSDFTDPEFNRGNMPRKFM